MMDGANSDRLADYYHSYAERKFEEAFSFRKWLLASFLAVNGGAIIALLGAESLDPRARFFALCWFGAGLLSALTAGLFQAGINNATGTIALDLSKRVISATDNAEVTILEDEAKQNSKDQLRIPILIVLTASVASYLSILVGGLIVIVSAR